jgi:hypothetical protein
MNVVATLFFMGSMIVELMEKEILMWVKYFPISSQIIRCWKLPVWAKKNDEGKVRPIKLTFSTQTERNHILQESNKLKTLPENVFMTTDKCLLDQKEDFRLRQSVKLLKKDNPLSKVIIKRGKLYVDDEEVDKEDPLKHLFKSD